MLAGLLGVVTLTIIWHFLISVPSGTQVGYKYSEFFLSCLSLPFVVFYFAVGLSLGCILHKVWSVALGMMSPLPIAFGFEILSDFSNHNLFPFEVLLFWIPAFSIAFFGAFMGEMLAKILQPNRFTRNDDV